MIRIRGFARKTRRLTKGGSLPDPAREISARNGESDHDKNLNSNIGNNGHGNGNGNGSSVIHHERNPSRTSNGNGDRGANGDNGNTKADGDRLTSYLNDVVEQLVDGHSPIEGRPPLEGNGHRQTHTGKLETIFARASVPVRPIPRWKRIFDITCIALTLPVWLPLLLVVMAWIKVVSPGPIFYRQERVGYRRRRFLIFKFRTMHVNAETRTHEEYFAHLMNTDCPMTKLDAMDDTRLIRCGRLLRASGLDELPQLFNVLRGEMSLVGPRPCLPNEFDRYTPAQQERVNAPPGLTGYWQVNGKNKTTFTEMIAMDIYYAEHMSLWLDISIISRTIPALLAQTMESRTRPTDDPDTPVSAPALNGPARKV